MVRRDIKDNIFGAAGRWLVKEVARLSGTYKKVYFAVNYAVMLRNVKINGRTTEEICRRYEQHH